jgi:FKBP-type peptidyl-prolyl cis-trans isomerase
VQVSVHYTGKLQGNGKIFDSTVGKSRYKFRLDAGKVIKGLDVGLNGNLASFLLVFLH